MTRFLKAQDPVYAEVLGELRAGRKRSHWMWFIFPQLAGLGHSSTAQHYAIASLEEAKAYLADMVLGERLRTCTRIVLSHPNDTAEQIFGYPDWMKFRSSMTLFDHAEPQSIFADALEVFFGGEADQRTLKLLGRD